MSVWSKLKEAFTSTETMISRKQNEIEEVKKPEIRHTEIMRKPNSNSWELEYIDKPMFNKDIYTETGRYIDQIQMVENEDFGYTTYYDTEQHIIYVDTNDKEYDRQKIYSSVMQDWRNSIMCQWMFPFDSSFKPGFSFEDADANPGIYSQLPVDSYINWFTINQWSCYILAGENADE